VVPGYTVLSEKGAYSASKVYSPSDVKDIVTYAAAVRSFLCHVCAACPSLPF
jgi:hypothetical protein